MIQTQQKPATAPIDPDDLQALRRLAEGALRGAVPSALYLDIDGQPVSVRIRPVQPTSCELDLLDLIAEKQPVTTSKIIDQLEARGQLHGESTVRKTLSRLVKSGQLIASRFAPRGYRLPGAITIIPENIQ